MGWNLVHRLFMIWQFRKFRLIWYNWQKNCTTVHSTKNAQIIELYQKLGLLLASLNIWLLFWFQVEKEYTIYEKEQVRLIKIFLVSLILAIFIGYFHAISRESNYIAGPKIPEVISASNATIFGKLFSTQQPIIISSLDLDIDH